MNNKNNNKLLGRFLNFKENCKVEIIIIIIRSTNI